MQGDTVICPCGRPITRHQYGAESEENYAARGELQRCRAKCRRLYPVAKPRSLPPLPSVSPTYGKAELRAVEKVKTARDTAYLDFIRAFDCVECGWPAHLGGIEAHHVETGATSLRCSDYLTVPLCSFDARGCHANADKTPTSVEKYKPWARRFNALWIAGGGQIKKHF